MANYNIKLLLKTITGSIPLPSEMDIFYKKLVRGNIAPKEPEIHKKSAMDREMEILLRNVTQIHELTEILQRSELGGWRIHAFSVNLIQNQLSGGMIHQKTAMPAEDVFPPLKYDLIRDPERPEFLTDICLFDMKNEPLPMHIWRDVFITFSKADILDQLQPNWQGGQDFQTLRIKRMQGPQTDKLIEIITQNPEIGAFRLQQTSNRIRIPRNDGSLKPKDAEMIIHTFSTQKETDRLNQQLAEQFKYEIPVRLGLDGQIKE